MRLERRAERFWGFVFVLPTLVLLAVFAVLPALIAGYYSLTRYDLLSPPKFTGFDNFAHAFRDGDSWLVIGNTLFMCIGVPVGMTIALLLGVLLVDRRLRFAGLYRSVYFLPVILPLVAIGTVWVRLLNTEYGLVNQALNLVGIPDVPWLTSYEWSKTAVMIVGVWSGFGGALVVLMGGISSIPETYYEAARMDGAGSWALLRFITLPLLVPSLALVSITSFIGALQVFDLAVVLTGGGPGRSSTPIALYIFQNFRSLDMGYAAALSALLFALMFALSVAQFRLGERLRQG